MQTKEEVAHFQFFIRSFFYDLVSNIWFLFANMSLFSICSSFPFLQKWRVFKMKVIFSVIWAAQAKQSLCRLLSHSPLSSDSQFYSSISFRFIRPACSMVLHLSVLLLSSNNHHAPSRNCWKMLSAGFSL